MDSTSTTTSDSNVSLAKPNSVLSATPKSQEHAPHAYQVPPSTFWTILALAQPVSMRIMESAPSAMPSAHHAKSPHHATPALIQTETSTTTATVSPVSMMPESTSVLPATHPAPPVQALQSASPAMPESSEPSRTTFASVKMDTSNSPSKTEPKSAPSAHQNAKPALKAPFNAHPAIHPSTESKVTTVWVTVPASVKPVTTPSPTERAFKATASPTSTALNAKPISRFVSNAKPQSTESSSSQNTSVSVPTDSSKTRTEPASHALKVAQSVHLPQNATPVLPKPLTTVMEHANVPPEPSSESQPTTSDTANNVSNTVTSAETHSHAKPARADSPFQLTTPVSALRTITSIQRESVSHAKPDAKPASSPPHAKSVSLLWSSNKTTVLPSAARVIICQVPSVSDAQPTVSPVPQPTNASTARMASS